jgi:hypothetical protein
MTRPQFNRCATPADLDPAAWHPAVRAASEWLLRGQHACRGWEYSQALYAHEQFAGDRGSVLDVGGAGSLAYRLFLQAHPGWPGKPYTHVTRVDPALPVGPAGQLRYQDADGSFVVAETLAEYLRHVAPYRTVLCLSVLEHVPAGQQGDFLSLLAEQVAPGGLLVLTCDLGEDDKAGDPYHFHWMRGGWIPTAEGLQRVFDGLLKPAFSPVALPNYTWPGPVVYDYTVASLILRRRT